MHALVFLSYLHSIFCPLPQFPMTINIGNIVQPDFLLACFSDTRFSLKIPVFKQVSLKKFCFQALGPDKFFPFLQCSPGLTKLDMMASSFVMALEYLHVSTKSRYESYSLGPSAVPSSRREGLDAGVANSHKISILTSGESLLLQLSLNLFSAIKTKQPVNKFMLLYSVNVVLARG